MKKKYKKYSIYCHFNPGFATIGTHRPQAVTEIPMVLVLTVNLGFIHHFQVITHTTHTHRSISKLFVKKNIENILFIVISTPDLSLWRSIGPKM